MGVRKGRRSVSRSPVTLRLNKTCLGWLLQACRADLVRLNDNKGSSCFAALQRKGKDSKMDEDGMHACTHYLYTADTH